MVISFVLVLYITAHVRLREGKPFELGQLLITADIGLLGHCIIGVELEYVRCSNIFKLAHVL